MLGQLEHRLQDAVVRFYGSFARARRVAGLRSYEPPRKWSRAAVLDALRRLHGEGLRISADDLREAGHRRLIDAAFTYVGGLRRARSLVGIPEPARRSPATRLEWDDETIISEIRARHRTGEPLASSKVPRSLLDAARNHLGSWEDAVEAAGIDYDSVRLTRTYSDEELLEEIRTLASRYPERTFAEAAPNHLMLLVYRRFGPIAKAASRAGVVGWGRRLQPAYTRAATLRGLRARARVGKSVQDGAIRAEEPALWAGVSLHFATWAAALKTAKLRDRSNHGVWNRRTVIERLRARHEAGKSMSGVVVRRDDRPLHGAAQRYFGSYVAAAARFGAKAQRVPSWTKDSLLAELRRLVRGRRPIPRSLRDACGRHLGGVKQALRAAGLPDEAARRRPRRASDLPPRPGKQLSGRGADRGR
jgi:hypothetical protein